MKIFFALALIAGVALGNLSTHHYGWTPNKEFLYRFETQNLVGIPSIKNQFAGLKLSSEVLIQTSEEYSLTIKFQNPKFIVVNQELIKGPDGRPELPEASQEIPSELLRPLTEPFVAHLKRGVVESLLVERDEPVVVTNIKKALLSQIQMDITGLKRHEVQGNNLIKEQEQPIDVDQLSYFTTEETTLVGECQTSYNIHRVPEYQAIDIEEQLKNEEQIFRKEGELRGEPNSRGDEICRGKKYFQITRVKNFDHCKRRPIYQSATGMKVKCDISKAECKDIMTQLSTTSYLVCGESLRDFIVRKVSSDNNAAVNPMGWNTNDEKILSTSRVTLLLLKVKTGFSPLPKPVQTKEKRSLIFDYPVGDALSSQSHEELEQRVSSVGPAEPEFKPIFPMPDMTSAPKTVIPRYIPIHEMIQQILSELEKIVSTAFKSPESCSSRSDVSGNIMTISQTLRFFSLEELKQLDQQIKSKFSSESEREIVKDLFGDILSMTGTNPSIMLIKEKIERREWSESTTLNIIQNMIRSVKTPTQEVFKTILEIVKSLKSEEMRIMYNTGLVSLSNLVYKACVHPEYKLTQFPVRIFGWFCHKDSSFITEEYIPYLVSQLERSELKRSEHMVIISALGKLGHEKTLMPLIKVIEGKIPRPSSEKVSHPMTRSLAVYSLKRLAKREPSLIKPILLTLIDNLGETSEVRIAAVAVLPWTQPSTSDLQKIAVRSWFEPSKQVAAFIYSTLSSLPRTEVPELKYVGQRAKGLKNLMKPFKYGFEYSHNMHSNQFMEYLRTVSSVETSYVYNEVSYLPSRVKVDSKLYGGSWIMQGVSFSMYTEGMDALVDRVFDRLGYKSEVSEEVRQKLSNIVQKLNIRERSNIGDSSPETLIQMKLMDMELMLPFDQYICTEMITKLMEDLQSGGSILDGRRFSKTHAFVAASLEVFLPTESGFLAYIERNMPVVFGLKGEVKVETEYYKGLESKLKAKLIPTINTKVQSNFGIICPFNKELLASGVEMAMHLSMPFKTEVEVKSSGEIKMKLSNPEEIRSEVELVHLFIRPYTVNKRLTRVMPTSQSPNAKKIVSGVPEKRWNIPFGQLYGLSGRVEVNSDMVNFDLPELWRMLSQHNVGSILSGLILTPSIRETSVKVVYNPVDSQTKEIETSFNIVYGSKTEMGEKRVFFPAESEVSAEAERQIDSVCRSKHTRTYEVEKCVQKKLESLESRRVSHKKVKEMLEKLEKGASIRGLHVETALNLHSGHAHKAIQTVVLFGGQRTSKDTYKTILQLFFKSPESPVYEMEMETKTVLPEIKYKWDVQGLINEEVKMETEVLIKYGKKDESKKELRIETVWSKSPKLKEAIANSKEMRKCQEELSKDRPLASVCEETRHLAASVDKIWLKMNLPESWKRWELLNKAEDFLQGYLFTYGKSSERLSERSGDSFEMTSTFSKAGDVLDLVVKTPFSRFELEDVRVPLRLRNWMPLSLRNGITLRLIQDISRDQTPASCRINPEEIQTFDNKTYWYKVNECSHLVFKDCTSNSLTRPLAVLLKKSSSSESTKDLEILSGKYVIDLKFEGEQSIVKINRETVRLEKEESFVKKSSRTGLVELYLFRTRDNVIIMKNPVEGMQVFFDGKKVEVVAPQMLRHRSCGLCGDLNGENTADLRTPEKYLMSKPKFVGYSYMITEGSSCPGIPREDVNQYEEEKRMRVQKRDLITPLESFVRRLETYGLKVVKPVTKTHVVEITRDQICISKKMIKVCQDGTKPEKAESKVVRLACLDKTRSESHQLLKRVRSGECVELELEESPVVFTKKVFQPVKCVKHGEEQEQQWNYRAPRRY
jgi:hypothetical protein